MNSACDDKIIRTMKRQRQLKKQKKDKEEKLYPLSNFEIEYIIFKLKIPHFAGVYMLDTLLLKKPPKRQECWILNHGRSETEGTHWTALAKNYNTAYYFDSFGKLPPPLEVLAHLNNNTQLFYNVKRYQKYGTVICGHLTIKFLFDFWRVQNNI